MDIYLTKQKVLIFLCSFLIFFCSAIAVKAIDSQEIIFARALQESREGDFLQALASWDKLIDLSSDNGVAFSNRGNVRLALGDPEGAILDQKRAIELLPNEIDPYLNKGIAEEVLARWDEAADDYNRVLMRDPKNSNALYNLGWVRGSQGEWLEAKNQFAQASIVNPSFSRALFGIALADYQLENLETSELELRSLIRKYPMFPEFRSALTALLWREGLVGEAESNWVAVAGLDNRYLDSDFLKESLRWPSEPIEDLLAFIDLKR